jgi:hypothetical protein
MIENMAPSLLQGILHGKTLTQRKACMLLFTRMGGFKLAKARALAKVSGYARFLRLAYIHNADLAYKRHCVRCLTTGGVALDAEPELVELVVSEALCESDTAPDLRELLFGLLAAQASSDPLVLLRASPDLVDLVASRLTLQPVKPLFYLLFLLLQKTEAGKAAISASDEVAIIASQHLHVEYAASCLMCVFQKHDNLARLMESLVGLDDMYLRMCDAGFALEANMCLLSAVFKNTAMRNSVPLAVAVRALDLGMQGEDRGLQHLTARVLLMLPQHIEGLRRHSSRYPEFLFAYLADRGLDSTGVALLFLTKMARDPELCLQLVREVPGIMDRLYIRLQTRDCGLALVLISLLARVCAVDKSKIEPLAASANADIRFLTTKLISKLK